EDDLRRLPGGEEAVGLVGLGQPHPVGDDPAGVEAPGPDEGHDLVHRVVEVGDAHGEVHALQPEGTPWQVHALLEVDAGDRHGPAHADVAGDSRQGGGVPGGVHDDVGA